MVFLLQVKVTHVFIFFIAAALIFAIGATWIFMDISERFDPIIAIFAVVIYIALFPVFPIVLLGYYLFVVLADRGSRTARLEEAHKAYFASDALKRLQPG